MDTTREKGIPMDTLVKVFQFHNDCIQREIAEVNRDKSRKEFMNSISAKLMIMG